MPSDDSPRVTIDAQNHLHRNVAAIAALDSKSEEQVERSQRLVEQLARQVGRPRSMYLVVLLVVAWTSLNWALLASHRAAIDPPPFFWMQGVVSLLALLLTIVVLTTQNRLGHKAERQGHLELQINLHAEQKITKLVQLVEELRRDLPSVPNRVDSTADSMSRSADPALIASVIDQRFTEKAEGQP